MSEALIGNAADAEQVKSAKVKEKTKREIELNDLRILLSLPEGKRFLWRLMERCRVFESIYSDTNMIYYNSGRQDVGHFVMAEITGAEPMAFIEMMKGNK